MTKVTKNSNIIKNIKYISLLIGVIVIFCAGIIILFPALFINKYIENKIEQEFSKVYPEYSLKIFNLKFEIIENTIAIDSATIVSDNKTRSFNIIQSKISGVKWFGLIIKGSPISDILGNVIFIAKKIHIKYQKSQYEFVCQNLFISVKDSIMRTDNLKINPYLPDEQFFDESKFRKSTYRLDIPEMTIQGLDCTRLLQGDSYRAGLIQIKDCQFDIVAVKYKPEELVVERGTMPNELISCIKNPIQIDSIIFLNGNVKYQELFAKHSKRAFVTFDNLQLTATNLSNSKTNDTLAINAHANLWNSGLLTLCMNIPLSSPKFNLQYSGKLKPMKLDKVNLFLEAAENKRVESGYLHGVNFNVNAIDGQADGYLRGEYENLNLAFIDERTGSGNGLGNRLKSFIANTFRIRGSNMPDKSGNVKLGRVKYTRESDDTFIEFVWVSLRGSIVDTIGI